MAFQRVRPAFRWAFGGLIILVLAACLIACIVVGRPPDHPWILGGYSAALLCFAIALLLPASRWPFVAWLALVVITSNVVLVQGNEQYPSLSNPLGTLLLLDGSLAGLFMLWFVPRRWPLLFVSKVSASKKDEAGRGDASSRSRGGRRT